MYHAFLLVCAKSRSSTTCTRHEYHDPTQRVHPSPAKNGRHDPRGGIQITNAEADRIDVVDFGFGQLAPEGVQVFTMFTTDRISAKVLVMLPNQTEPEHWHPPMGDDPGKRKRSA